MTTLPSDNTKMRRALSLYDVDELRSTEALPHVDGVPFATNRTTRVDEFVGQLMFAEPSETAT